MQAQKRKPTAKVQKLLTQHQLEIIEGMGPQALDLLTPSEVASILEIETKNIPDLIRQDWLTPVPGKDIGSAHQYYRWRVEFVRRYKSKYQSSKKTRIINPYHNGKNS